MDAVRVAYRNLAARAGKAELAVHVAFILYGLLLFVAAFLNLAAPSWVSRNNSDYVLSSLSLSSSSSSPSQSSSQAEPLRFASSSSSSFSSSSSSLWSHLFFFSSSPRVLTLDQERAVSRCVSRGFLLDLFDDPVVARVRNEMECGCKAPDVYEPHEAPVMAAIVQSFNHAGNVARIAEALVSNPAIDEIIVCEDGSVDGSLELWTEALRGVRHFIVVSNNLHEVRCYNRAMRSSSARYFLLLQDDDLPPSPSSTAHLSSSSSSAKNWVLHARQLFEADDKLALISGFIGQLWDPVTGAGFEFGEQTSDHGGTRKGSTYRLPFLHPATRQPFMFCECAWAAPLFVRADALHRTGGLDVGLFNAREPGVWQDCVLSYATWTAGWRVGVFDSRFRRGVGGHGSTSSLEKTKLRDTVWQRAKAACDSRYDRPFIHSQVLLLNNQTLQLRAFDTQQQTTTSMNEDDENSNDNININNNNNNSDNLTN